MLQCKVGLPTLPGAVPALPPCLSHLVAEPVAPRLRSLLRSVPAAWKMLVTRAGA